MLLMPPMLTTARGPVRGEHGGVEGRHERRALAAGREVAAAEVRHDVDLRQFGQSGGRIELDRVARRGAVPDRLAVSADREDVGRCTVGLLQDIGNAVRVDIDQALARRTGPLDLVGAG